MCDEQTMTQATPSWSFSSISRISHLRPISSRRAGEGSTEMPCLTVATPYQAGRVQGLKSRQVWRAPSAQTSARRMENVEDSTVDLR